LLREQDTPKHRGEIPYDEAVRRLVKEGFSEDDAKHVYIEDTIEDFYTSFGDESNVRMYGLVKEYEKTDEYKQWREEIDEKAAEKEARRYRFTEECETTDPIYGRLDQLADRQGEDLDLLEMKRETMDEDEYLRKKKEIETRDSDEESQWKQIIEMIYELPFDILIDLRNLLWKGLPTPEFVLEFLEKKSREKKSA
jgi:hypothetical protein